MVIVATPPSTAASGHPLAVTTEGWLALYAGTGDPAQPVANAALVGHGWTGFDDPVGIGDGNGDGYDDLIARTNGQVGTAPS